MTRPPHIRFDRDHAPHPDLLPCGIVRADDKQRVTYVNRCLLDWLDLTAEQVVGKRCFPDLLSVGGRILFETHHFPRLEMEEQVAELQYDLLKSGGGKFSATINAAKDGQGYVYVILPFSDRRKYERELRAAKERAEAADRAKSSFLSIMSHEIRTPLHAIIEGGNFLLKESPRPDQLELILAQRTAGENLLTIVNDILDISKMESGKLELASRPFLVGDLLDGVRSVYASICRQKSLDFRLDVPDTRIPPLLGDAGKLGQVLTNLVSNAAKFTTAGEIVLRLRHRLDGNRHRLRFSVRDTGIGIEPDRLEAIFEPFTQASADTQVSFGGTGLGLAICQRILLAYGSRMEVTSQPGAGTTFGFELRLAPAPVTDAVPAKHAIVPREPTVSLGHLRVLNVDDNSANLLINARYFKEWGLRYEQYADGYAALDALEERSFDLVLLDLRMPGLSGYELAQRIRCHPSPGVANLPLIALSASYSKEVSAKMLAAGINGLVLKPFDPAHLHQVIRECGENKGKVRFNPAAAAAAEPEGTRRNFRGAREIFAGSERDYRAFLTMIQADLGGFREELTQCTQDFSGERYFTVRHNLLSTVRVFGLRDLKGQLNEGRQLLDQRKHVAFVALVATMQRQLDAFAVLLGEEIAGIEVAGSPAKG